MSSIGFKPKSYLVPEDPDELLRYLKEFGERAKIIAGGTGIYEIAHRGLLSDLEALIDIRRLDLSYVKAASESVAIGASTTMTTLLNSPEITTLKELSALLDALNAIQPLQVKNVATIAGAICTALPFFDLPVALLSIGAKVRIEPTERLVALSDFIKGYFAVDLDQSEYVCEIQISTGKERAASAFQKFAVTHDDWALINCGASVSLDRRGRISEPTIIFGGGVGDKPVRAIGLERSLKGVEPNDESKIKDIFDSEVSKDLEPVSDIRSSAEYRMHLAAVIGRRTFLQAAKRI
jgi:CO/xanthine dehydrogenase FAD-binding subunit